MRAAPRLQVVVSRFGVWRAALAVLIAAASASLLAWGWEVASTLPLVQGLGWGAAAFVCLAAAGSTLRQPAFRLQFDGRAWQVAALQPSSAAWSGRLVPRVDLGAWMLLRFVPDAGSAPCPLRWLPVQRGGLEAQWHALRCAVYSARFEPDATTRAGATASVQPHE